MLELFETIKIDHEGNYDLAPHLARLSSSLKYFGKEGVTANIAEELIVILSEAKDPHATAQKRDVSHLSAKLKITIPLESNPEAASGQIQGKHALYSLEPYTRFQDPNYIIKIKLLNPKRYHSLSTNPLNRHKTNKREDFSDVLLDCDEVIWLNERGEIAEGSYTNIFWQDAGGAWHTPDLETGILAGTMRAQSLRGAKQGFYPAKDLHKAQRILITNSMLGAREAKLIN